MTDQKQEIEGVVAQVQGAVVDVDFPAGAELPNIFDAIRVPREGDLDLILEVQNHLGHGRVRTVAMDTTDGLARGTPAFATGAPISVPSTTVARFTPTCTTRFTGPSPPSRS